MTLTEASGVCVTLGDTIALESWDRTVHGVLSHGFETPKALSATLEASPGFALGWATKGLLMLLLGRAELVPVARDALAQARAGAAAGGATARERAYISALEDWLSGRPSRAAGRMAGILAEMPGDTLAMKLDQSIRFMLGDRRGMEAGMRAAMPGIGADHVHHGFARGCLAFALEENGHYAEAEREGRGGLETAPEDVWGLHAVAHVCDMQGRSGCGIEWLEGRDAQWAHCNNFGYHVWWHLALFRLDRGEYDAVLELYDTRIRAEHTDDYRDISNGASLLLRLEIEGIDVGSRWDELASLSAARITDGCVVFADLHYLMALGGDGRRDEADRLIARIAVDAQRSDHDMHEVAGVAGHSAATGLAAFRSGHYGLAFDSLRSVRGPLQRIGGSHAQRDVFSRLMIEAAIRAGRLDEADWELRARAGRRGAVDGYTERRLAAVSRARTRRGALTAAAAELGA